MSSLKNSEPVHILYVEDDCFDRQLVARTLLADGLQCEFVFATTEAEFNRALAHFTFDVILSDFTLPSFIGTAALALAKAAQPEVPFLFVSGTIGEERAVETLKSGAQDYVNKEHLGRLSGAIRRALREAEQTSERKKAEEALRAGEERFRELAETIQEVFWVTDPGKNRILYISPAYEKIWGRTCQSLYAEPGSWLEAIHSDDRQRVLRSAATQHTSDAYDEEYRILRPDGQERWIRDRAFPVRNAAGEVQRIVGLARDITERRQLEEQLRQSQKMEALGQLAGGVAHDFNNMLAVIQGHASLLASQSNLAQTARDSANAISLAAERAASLTRQLLTFGRRQIIQIRALNLNHLIEGVLNMLRRVLGANVALQFTAGDIPPLLADAGMLDQALINLAVNARDAMSHSGTLHICTSAQTLKETVAEQ